MIMINEHRCLGICVLSAEVITFSCPNPKNSADFKFRRLLNPVWVLKLERVSLWMDKWNMMKELKLKTHWTKQLKSRPWPWPTQSLEGKLVPSSRTKGISPLHFAFFGITNFEGKVRGIGDQFLGMIGRKKMLSNDHHHSEEGRRSSTQRKGGTGWSSSAHGPVASFASHN